MDEVTPTPAPPPATPTDTLANLTPDETLAWRQTGNIPVKPLETAPSTEDDDAEDEPPPVAATTEPRTISKRQQKINEQIRLGVEAELTRRAAIAPPVETPRPTPTPNPPAPVVADASDPEPDATDLTKYPGGEYDPKYLREISRWDARQERRQEAAEAQTRARQTQAAEAFQGSVKATADAFAARFAADPTFNTSLDQGLMQALIPISQLPAGVPPQPINIIAEELLGYPGTAPDIALFLSTHPAELARLTARTTQGVPVLSVPQLIREIGRLDARLERAADAPPPPSTLTEAPPPPTTLGTRSTTPADPVEAAIKRKDAGAYMREMNARELAATRK